MSGIYPPTPPVQGGAATMLPWTGVLQQSGGGGGGTSYSLAITNDPATGTIGSVIDFSGTVAPSGQAVQFGLSTNATIFAGGTFAGGTLGGATVAGTLWNAYETLNTAGTFYPFGEITGQTTVVGSGIVVSSPSAPLSYTQVGSSPSGGITGVGPFSAQEVNLVTPLAHGSSVNPSVTWSGPGSVNASGGAVTTWYDTSATNTSSSGGTVASGTLNSSVGGSGGVAYFYAGSAPSAAGTYYHKVQFVVTGTDPGTYTFVSQAVTVT